MSGTTRGGIRNAENDFDVLFWGDWALFANPLTMLSGSKYSYAIPTLSAIKGMLKSIYWKPSVEWEVESLEILKPIQRETKNVLLQANRYQSSQRGTNNYLKDVAYRIKAHMIPSAYANAFKEEQQHGIMKHATIAHSRFRHGSGYATPVLGVSECMAFTCETEQRPDLIESPYYADKELYLDTMLLDIIYPLNQGDTLYRIFWIPKIKNGIVDFPNVHEILDNRKANSHEYIVEELSPQEYTLSYPTWTSENEKVIADV